ncbi:MAG: metallophosphoesterase [Candidatus Ratteibacteria bacterium]|jgi:3',5'-cyclic AMP phosphodiesterase CpdA
MKKLLLVSFFWIFLALPASAETWYFAVVGDTQGPGLTEPVSPVFDKVIAQVNELKPDFMVHLGDKVYGSGNPGILKKQFLTYRQKTEKLDLFLYEVPGNHDVPNKNCYPIYRDMIFARRYYSFDHNGCHFVVLSSEEKPGLSGGLGKKQLAWLDEDLKEHAGIPVFVFMHRPLYRGIIHPYILADAGELERVLQRYKVKYLFAGHEHRFGISHQGGMIEYISGGGGAPLLNFSEESGGFYHFLMVKVEDGKPEVDFVKIDYPKTYQDFGNLWKAYQRLKKPSTK